MSSEDNHEHLICNYVKIDEFRRIKIEFYL
nr:MAG TPA: hypothetical protein [Caudoviricetes sp.]